MDNDELANSAVQTVAQYLIRKNQLGSAATYDNGLENLLVLFEVKLVDLHADGGVERFKNHPESAVEAGTVRLHLVRAIGQDADFRDQLVSAMGAGGGGVGKSRGKRVALTVFGLVAALGLGVVLARAVTPGEAAPATVTVTSSPQTTTTATTTTTSTTTSSGTTTTAPPKPTSGSSAAGVPGDGSVLAKGAPVYLTELPRPEDDWVFKYGDHDVQLTQYSQSLWFNLAQCNSSRQSGVQQFRLKNFSRFEAKAVGTDSTASPSLAVKYEVFVNDDTINPVIELVANPGEAKPLAVDLPPGTFALTLRTSLTTADKSACKSGNAVWGSPHVIAAGR
ncbi:hypothetical protein [Umezawaea sp. Da 62-37]|uniref:hypothetical protein n=1 Tax=Umezawaea sp. Da 62-37 TaxID=3075927 RepID=UPI0028F6C28C|nr:hypothetical protein [Umezawaea sp. Da 62-37]WNV85332.1 hypothetical protein RM788_45655 [Umezawaea sp. Da 62-37]